MDNAYLVAGLWMGLALLASLVSIKVGISVALIEIALGVVGGNVLGLHSTPWIDFLASFGAVLLTFLAGAEIDPDSLRRHLRVSLAVGSISFAVPFVAAFAVAYITLGWTLQASEIAGLALSTTSVAVVYAVMIESGLAAQEIGKVILAACFITDLGTVLFLGLLFANVSPLLVLFAAATAVAFVIVPRVSRLLGARVPGRVSEPEIKFLFLVLMSLGGLAQVAGSEAVLPAYLIGLAVAGIFVASRAGPPNASDGVLAAHAVLLPQGRRSRVAPGHRCRCRPDRAVPRRQGRGQGRRSLADRPRVRDAGAGR
jgi:Kef-type K+ transport system membrane component KefB